MANFYTGKTVMEAINDISTSNDISKDNNITREIKITPPEGFEIDRENSTLECIKFKPAAKRWRDNKNELLVGYFINVDCRILKTASCSNIFSNHDVFATEKQAKSALAMAQISQIMANDDRFGGVVTDEEWNDRDAFKFSINCNDKNKIAKFNGSFGIRHFLTFHTPKQRDLFLEENEDLVKEYLMID